MTLRELQQAAEGNADGELATQAQITRLGEELTKNGKPYLNLELADSTGAARLKIWSDSPAFGFLQQAKIGDAIELTGKFYTNDYGLNVTQPDARALGREEKKQLFAGAEERRRVIDREWDFLQETFESLEEPRLRAVCLLALKKYEKKWRRAAAARTYHHARRGGLLEHTAQMLRCAQVLAPLYPEIFPPLLYAGVLFHDIGKMWENDYEEEGFTSPHARVGELMGHITIGVEVVNQLWRDAKKAEPKVFEEKEPPSDLIREHLLHLIASHHGELQFGAPVTPRTPEAFLLHYIDNLDAKIEMLRCAYAEKSQLAPGIFEPRYPIAGASVLPLSEAFRKSSQ